MHIFYYSGMLYSVFMTNAIISFLQVFLSCTRLVDQLQLTLTSKVTHQQLIKCSNSRSNRPVVFCRKDVLRNFAKLTGKRLCQSLFFNKAASLRPAPSLKKRLWHRCFPENFAKFLRTPFFIEHLWWLFLKVISDHTKSAKLYIKFPHQKIRWNYGTFRSDCIPYFSKNNDFQSGALLKMPPSSSSM